MIADGNNQNGHQLQPADGEGPVVVVPWRVLHKPRQRKFIAEYLKTGDVQAAAEACGNKTPRNHYHWLVTDEKYRQAFEMCREYVGTILEDTLLQRAIYGWEEPVFGSLGGDSGTGVVGHKTRHDNTLGVKMLERLKPSERPTEQQGSTTINVSGTANIDASDRRAAVLAIIDRELARRNGDGANGADSTNGNGKH